MQFTQESEGNKTINRQPLMMNNLIISNEPLEPLNELYSPCISVNQFTFDFFKQRSASISSQDEMENAEPPPPSKMTFRDKQILPDKTQNILISPQEAISEDAVLMFSPGKSSQRPEQVQPTDDRWEQGSPKVQESIPKNMTRSGTELVVGTTLMQFFHLRRFMGKLLVKKKHFSMIGPYHMQLINDKAASSFKQTAFTQARMGFRRIIAAKEQGMCSKFSENFSKSMNRLYDKLVLLEQDIPKIQPQSKMKVIWDIFITFMRVYFMLLIPIQVAFTEQFLFSPELNATTTVATVFLVLDEVLSFNTAYYEFGQLVDSRKRIAWNSVCKHLGIELFSVIMLIIVFFLNNNTWFELVMLTFLVQYVNIIKLLRQFEEVLDLSKKQSSILELAKLILAVVYILHLFSCLWFWCGSYSTDNFGQSWLMEKNLVNQNWYVQYLNSFYYSTVTMFTVGYGDITPQSDLEIIISICFMMICSIQLSYSVNTVGSIINKISKVSENKLKKLRILNTYMSKKIISSQLQFQIREYLNYYWESQQAEETTEEKEIINQLSEKLREKLMVEANSNLLNGSPLFSTIFSEQFKMKLVKSIKVVAVQPENIIDFSKLVPDGQSNIFMSFIEAGSVEVFHQTENVHKQSEENVSLVKKLVQGENFGLKSFLSGVRSKEYFRSVGFTKLIILSIDDFLRVVQDYPEDREKYCGLRDEILYQGGYKTAEIFKIKCSSCQSNTHAVINCPILHFVVNKEKTIKSHQFSRLQLRNESKIKIVRQKQKNSFYALNDQTIIAEVAGFIQKDYWKLLQAYDNEEQEQISDNESVTSLDGSRRKKISGQSSLANSSNTTCQKIRVNKQVTIPLDSIAEDVDQVDQDNIMSQESIKLRNKGRLLQSKSRKRLSCSPPLNSDSYNSLKLPSLESNHSYTYISNMVPKPHHIVDHGKPPIDSARTSIMTRSDQGKPLSLQPKDQKQLPPLKSALKVRSFSDKPKKELNEKLKKIQIKFKRALEFVKKLNQTKLKVNKVAPRFTIETSIQHQIQLASLQQLKDQLGQIQLRQKKKQYFKNKDDVEQLDLLYISIGKQINIRNEILDFERSENFKHYFIDSNIITVINQPMTGEISSTFSTLVKYMFYPNLFTSQYKNRQPVIRQGVKRRSFKEHTEAPKKAYTKQVQTYKEILKVRNIARKIIQSRQNVQRITPSSE